MSGSLPWRDRKKFDLLRNEMDRLFNRFFDWLPSDFLRKEGGWSPSLDLSEANKKVLVKVEIPGMDAKDIDISLSGNVLAPKGERKRFGEMFKASNDLELYKCVDGGAGLYINHGFQAYAGQLYRGSEGLEVEVAIYDQGSARNARGLYQDPLTKADPGKVLGNLGDEARIDERGLFVYGVEFIQDRFFVRVLIQDRTENGLSIALLFAHHVSERIKSHQRQ